MINLLSPVERNELIQIPDDIDKKELIKFYNLSELDQVNINKYRTDPNRLGFSIQLCVLRHKGWPFSYIKNVPDSVISFMAEQLRIDHFLFKTYYTRKNTIFEHFKTIKSLYGYKSFSEDESCMNSDYLSSLLEKTDNPYLLICDYIDKLKSSLIVLPAIYKIEEIVGSAKNRNEIKIIETINATITKEQQEKLNLMLEQKDELSFSFFAWVKEDTGKPSIKMLLDIIKKIEYIDNIGFNNEPYKIPAYKAEQLIKLGKRYEPFLLKRFEDKKRFAIMAVYLKDLRQCLIDKAIIIHDIKMNSIFNKIKKAQAEQVKKHQKAIKEAISDYIQFGSTIIEANENNKDLKNTIENEITWDKLRKSIFDAKQLSKRTQKSTLDMLNSYYGELRKYSPVLLQKLSFENTSNACEELIGAIGVIKDLNESKKVNLPDDVEVNFTNKKWCKYIGKKDGHEKRHYYEIAVLNELKNKVRSGDVSITGSKSFRNFEDYLVSKKDWEKERIYTRLTVEKSFEEYIAAKKAKLSSLLRLYSRDCMILEEILGDDEKIHLKKLEASTPSEAKSLSMKLYSMLPKINLPDIIYEVMNMTSFHKHFLHAATQQYSEDPEDIKTLIFTLMAIGTNVGLSKMADAIGSISYKQLAYQANWKIFDENLQNAQAAMVNHQLEEPLTTFWGDGTTSSSDGMRVNTVDTLNAGYTYRLGYKKIVTIHRFVNDKYSAFYTTVSSPANREGIHIIDGILRHRSKLNIKEHYTDTAGYTDQVFALSSLMGFHFAPRIRNLPDSKLYLFKNTNNTKLSKIAKGTINEGIIQKNFDEVLRLAHSIREEKVKSSLILSKLGSYARNNSLANALKEMGKVEKTIFILEYAYDPVLRRKILVGLNKGEEMHGLARAVHFGRRGQFWERELQEQLQKASCLNILLNAIVVWNTKYLTKAWKIYKQANPDADESLLKYISPLNWEHINFLGEYSYNTDFELEEDNLRKLIINFA